MQEPPRPNTTQHFLALDGLRGVAALAVMVMHKGRWFYAPGGFIQHAWLAVDFFFLLSGFVIAAAYERRLTVEGAGRMALPAFARVRLIRLYPMILLGLLLGVAWPLVRLACGDAGAAGLGPVLFSFARSLLLLPPPGVDPVGVGIFPLNGPMWSLLFELAVNLAYVLIVRRLTLPVLIAIVAISALLVATLPFGSGLDAGSEPNDFWWGVPRTSFGFFAGVLLYRLRAMGRLPSIGAPVWALALAITALFLVPHSQPWTPAFQIGTLFLVFPAILILGANAPASPRLDGLSRLSGGLSYPIYALHYPLLIIVGGMVSRYVHAPWLGLLGYPLVLGLCWLAWRFYDEPARAWLTRLNRGPPVSAQSSPQASADSPPRRG
jgi:peptidoglycan/LPS O-acetylase OafA/YrhL